VGDVIAVLLGWDWQETAKQTHNWAIHQLKLGVDELLRAAAVCHGAESVNNEHVHPCLTPCQQVLCLARISKRLQTKLAIRSHTSAS
jgi:hypothetical protein